MRYAFVLRSVSLVAVGKNGVKISWLVGFLAKDLNIAFSCCYNILMIHSN